MIGAVDSKGGHVVIHGWKTTLPITAVEAVQALEPYCGEFLYTHVDQRRADAGHRHRRPSSKWRAATSRPVTAAGGITTREEIDELASHGIHAVVGMAIYTGVLALGESAATG